MPAVIPLVLSLALLFGGAWAWSLRRQRDYWRGLLAAVPDVVITVGEDATVHFPGEAAHRLLGLGRGDSLLDWLAPASAAPVTRELRRACHGGAEEELEVRDRDGGDWALRMVPMAGGRDVLLALRAITGRKRMERELARREAQYRMLAENANDMISHHDENGVYRYVSPSCRTLLGYEPEELIGRSAYDFFHSDDLAAIVGSHRTIVEDGSTFCVTYRIRRRDHRYIWFETISTVNRGDSGQIVAISRDVSQRVEMERALRASESRYRTTVEVLAEGVVVQGLDGAIVSANATACEILGLASEAVRRLDAHDPRWETLREDGTPCPGDQHPAMVTLRSGEAVRDAVLGIRRASDGERVWIVVNTAPLRDEVSGALAGVVASFHDITEQKRLADELRALSAHLQAVREEEKAHVARDIHDELGSTLTVLKLHAGWLEQALPRAQPALHERLDAMQQLVDHAVATVRRIVSQLRPTVLDDLGLEAAIEWQAGEFQRHTGIPCLVDVACDVGQVPPDVAMGLFRMLQESLTNVARHAEAGEVRVDCWRDGAALVLSVEDDGVGLPQGGLAGRPGHGIRGMRERIAALGGELALHATPEGTLVTARVPIDRPSGAAA